MRSSQPNTSESDCQNVVDVQAKLVALRTKHDSIRAAQAQRAQARKHVERKIHPALTHEALARVRTAPRGAMHHVQLEALELESVVREAMLALETQGQWDTLEHLDRLEHHERAAVCLYATGQALRVPVCVRAGADDRHGIEAPGNGLGRLLAALSGSSTALSASTAHRAIKAGHEALTLARAARLLRQDWTDDSGKAWRRRFARGLLYVPVEHLRGLYLAQSWGQLVAAIGQAIPASWRKAAYLRARIGGYWSAIRPNPRRPAPKAIPSQAVLRAELREGRSFAELVQKHGWLDFKALRAMKKAIWEARQIRSSKRVQTTEGKGSPPFGGSASSSAKAPDTPKTGAEGARKAHQQAVGGEECQKCQTPVVHSTPPTSDPPRRSSFLAAIGEFMNSDHPLLSGLVPSRRA